MISGIINVLKPAGLTSNAVLTRIKKILNPKKIGHLGTLDPSAVGVLPVCINKATKLFDLYLQKEKTYRAVFVFGKTTDTLDSDGVVTNQNDVIVSKNDLCNVLKKFVGKMDQIPPQYSAKNINGKRAYELARQNIQFEIKSKQVEIYDIKLLEEIKQNTFLLQIDCSSGTYIRSIVRDIASSLKTFGYMAGLIRTKSGNFFIKDSIRLDDVSEDSIIPIQKVLEDKRKVFVNDKFYDKIINGCKISVIDNDVEKAVVFCKNQLIGIGNIKNGILTLQTNLRENQ